MKLTFVNVAVSGGTFELPVTAGARVRLLSLMATCAGVDANGDTLRLTISQSTVAQFKMDRPVIGMANVQWSLVQGASGTPGPVGVNTDPVSGDQTYITNTTAPCDAAPDIWFDQTMSVNVQVMAGGQVTSIVARYEILDLKLSGRQPRK